MPAKLFPLLGLAWLALVAPLAAAHGGDGDEESLDPDDARKLRTGKIIVLVVIGFATLAASAASWYLRRLKQAVHVMQVLSCFAGGVMIGAALCHMFPDVSEAFKTYFELVGNAGLIRAADAEYPFAFFIAGSVVILLIGLDKAIAHRFEHAHSHSNGDDDRRVSIRVAVATSTLQQPLSAEEAVQGFAVGVVPVADQQQYDDLEKERGSNKHIVDAYLFFFALSVHSIFDGLSIGAEMDLHGFYALMIALVTHKLLDGFALGVPVFYARLPLRHTLFALIFCACMTPLGIGIGWATTSSMSGARATLTRAIFLSISAGSFLFIAFIEMLPPAFEQQRHTLLKLLSCFFGFGIMALIALWV